MKSIETAENWVGLLPGLLKIMNDEKASPNLRATAWNELLHMARMADAYAVYVSREHPNRLTEH